MAFLKSLACFFFTAVIAYRMAVSSEGGRWWPRILMLVSSLFLADLVFTPFCWALEWVTGMILRVWARYVILTLIAIVFAYPLRRPVHFFLTTDPSIFTNRP
ncbi:MAG: hypothetical protein AAB839_02060 [Patescibacteria group bacterium]